MPAMVPPTDTPFRIASAFAPVRAQRYAGVLTEDWYQGRGVYGGMVAAILLRCLEAEVDASQPARTLSVSFIAPAVAGAAEVSTEILRRGRNVTQATARMTAGGALVATATGTFAAERRSAVQLVDRPMPALSPPGTIPSGHESLYIPAFCARHLEFRQALGQPPFSDAAEAYIAGWCRLAEPTRADAATIAALLDAWPQAALSLYPEWAPAASIDMTVQFLSPLAEDRRDDAYYAVEARCTHASGGYADEHATLWDSDGRPLAFARQLVALFA